MRLIDVATAIASCNSYASFVLSKLPAPRASITRYTHAKHEQILNFSPLKVKPRTANGVISPALAQTSRGQRIKRERLGTRLGFLQNTMKTLFRLYRVIESTFRSLEMHSKRRKKIFICSVFLGELETFRNCKSFSIIFLKILGSV